ncbi:ATP-binding protein [Nocardioides pyridinolyticus]
MARDLGCSHTTVSAAFSDARVPRWGLLELLVESLGGDTDEFRRLWLAATSDDSDDANDANDADDIDNAADTVTKEAPGEPPDGIPHQLPATAAGFVGRTDELAALDRLTASAGRADSATTVLVHGPAGVGKTTLTLRWARQRATRFPDGELFVDLRGYDARAPITAQQALEMLLHSVGRTGAAVPVEQDERAAAFRTLMARRRMVVVLDNAFSVEQVRDLLPGTEGSVVLVTSRSQLPSLVVRHGAQRLAVGLLPEQDALDLLRGLVGTRVDEAAAASAALVDQCARLPLAVRIAAELAASRPGSGIEDLVAELDEETERLTRLGVDDTYGAVRSVFSWSWQHLGADAARAFALLGAHPGRSISLQTAAAVLGVTERLARELLDQLVRANLIAELERHRYTAHDLLRHYATEKLAALPETVQREAIDRLDDSYLRAVVRATSAVHGVSFRGARGVVVPPPQERGDPREGREWLEDELANVVSVVGSSGSDRWPTPGMLARVLSDYLDERGLFGDAMRMHGHARSLAAQVGDTARHADATDDLARVLRRLGKYAEAAELHEAALATYRQTKDRTGEATTLHRLGVLEWRRGRYQLASEYLRAAVDLFAQLGDGVGQGNARFALGIALRRLGDYNGARATHEEAIAVLRRIGDERGEAAALNNVGMVLMLQGEHDLAERSFAEALECHLQLGQPLGAAVAWDNLGSLASRRGRHDEALACHRTALSEFVRLGYPAGEADSRRGIGVALAGLGQTAEALDALVSALELSRRVGEADVAMNAGCELGRVQLLLGNLVESEATYAEVVRAADGSGDRLLRATAWAGLSAVLRERGDVDAAARLRRRASAEFDDMDVEQPASLIPAP